MQAEVIEPVGNESVPPAEMVADEEHRSVGNSGGTVKRNAVKMPLQAVPRIEAEEAYKERNMSCLNNHFLLLTGTSDIGGLP